MEMTMHLMEFGFVSEIELLHALVRPTILCLDGRTDWLDAPKAGDAASASSAPADSAHGKGL